jgi:outer membrane protein
MPLSKDLGCIRDQTPRAWLGRLAGLGLGLFLGLGLVFSGPALGAPGQKNPEAQAKKTGLGLMQSISTTLSLQPSIELGRLDVESSRGTLEEEGGQFDPTLNASFSYGFENIPLPETEAAEVGADVERQETITSKIGVTKKTRSGITFTPTLEVERVSGLNTSTLQESTPSNTVVTFALNIPLLKGLGVEATGAEELAAKEDLEASKLDLAHTASQSVLNTTLAYWDYLAARKKLLIMREMEASASKSLKDMRLMVANDAAPASNLETLKANLAAKTADRVAAAQDLYSSRQGLGLAMGLAYKAIDDLALPSQPFPEPAMPKKFSIDQGALLKQAREQRKDLAALKTKGKSAKILLVSAENSLLPRLDLNLKAGYQGLAEGSEFSEYVGSIVQRTEGPNYGAGLKFQMPFYNAEARGILLQRNSALRKNLIDVSNLDRKIRSKIVVEVQALVRSMVELYQTRLAVKNYLVAVKNEKIKLRRGFSTVIDVMNLEDRLRDSMTDEVTRHGNFAQALARLRYETGNLITWQKGTQYSVDVGRLTKLHLR